MYLQFFQLQQVSHLHKSSQMNFAFLVNPGTLELEFWRVDYAGTTGAPMHIWKKWLNGSDTSRKWAVYINPNEYGSIV